MTYIEFIKKEIEGYEINVPVYTGRLTEDLAKVYQLPARDAAAAVSVAIKRLMDNKTIPELRCFHKGIYYRTKQTPFGETAINIDALIMDKYLADDNGYETGFSFLHRIGLTTQIPANRVFATNKAKKCIRADKALGIYVCPPKVRINAKNKAYLQTLDAIEAMGKAPVDVDAPYRLIADHIQANGLEYGELLFLADRYYNQSTVLRLAHIAGERRENQ